MKRLFLTVWLLLGSTLLWAQNPKWFDKIGTVEIQSDSVFYSTQKHYLHYQQEDYLFFVVNPVQQVYVFTVKPSPNIKKLTLMPSSDFEILDTLLLLDDEYYKTKIEFDRIDKLYFPRLVFSCETHDGYHFNKELKLYPYIPTYVQATQEVPFEAFVGEEVTVPLATSNVDNIVLSDTWQTSREAEYKVYKENGKLMLQFKPLQVGNKELVLNLKTIKPFLDNNMQMSNLIPPVTLNFIIKPGRLNFINFGRTDYFLDLGAPGMEEVQIDYNRNFSLKQIYRVEDKSEGGGKLIAELYTQSYVANGNKVLCYLRPYSLHRTGEGYLYIKDNGVTRFVTNFNVFEKPKIDKISLQRDGEDWTSNLAVYPGEEVEVRIEGNGLLKAQIDFEKCEARQDTVRRSDNIVFYYLRIPESASERKIPLYINNKISTYELSLREYQMPRDFDFINIDYAGKMVRATDKVFSKPVLYHSVIRDINITFQPEMIDVNDKFYGKQYLVVEVKVFNAKNELKEFQIIDNIVICPGENSIRSRFYDGKDCRRNPINLNDFLGQKTYDLEGWSKIEIVLKHKENRYTAPIYNRKIVLIKEKKVALDLQVSFPAGMLVKKFNQAGLGNLTGISTSVIVQLSFYDPGRIGRLRPYNVGMGFIAVDAFNFSSTSVNKDLGIVVLGSIHPVKKEKKFSFPIFAGAGYLLKSNTMFMVFGPGVQLNF
jgi:hypothetical protein